MVERSSAYHMERAPVFISYASPDAVLGASLVSNLEEHGIKCWIAPRDVRPGAEYADAIVAAITESKALVLVLTQHAISSSHVGREVERAASKGRPIIAIRLDNAPLNRSLEYFLSNSQWIDAQFVGIDVASSKVLEALNQAPANVARFSAPVRSSAENIPRPRFFGALAIMIGLGLIAVVGGRSWIHKHTASPPLTLTGSDKSIAVLPFVDLSEKRDQEYFADGMAEEILNLLTKIPKLRVIGRTSSSQFKSKSEDLRKIGDELHVAYILEGSVRKAGDRVRISAQLVESREGTQLWSESYDRSTDDILKLQNAIALGVVRELQLAVMPDFLRSRTVPKSMDAYDLLLRGRKAGDRLDGPGLDEAAGFFQRALELDPSSADAAASLAWTYDARAEWGTKPPALEFEAARNAAGVALTLDPTNALAHCVLARIHIVHDWDWGSAQREFDLVGKSGSDRGAARDSEALLSLALGHWELGLSQLNAALAQDPLDPPSLFILAEIDTRLGRLGEAEAVIRRALDIRPTQQSAHFILAKVLLAGGDNEGALQAMQQETSELARQEGLAIAYFSLGRKAESDAALNRMLEQQADENAMAIAESYAYRGQSNAAMQWLNRAYAQKDVGLYSIKADTLLKSLEGDTQYKAFLRKMNLPQ